MLTTALRLIETLQLIPRRGHGVSADELVRRLADRGWKVHVRTVQRDLQDLSGRFPLEASGKPLRWRWTEAARAVLMPGTDVPGAVVWRLVREHLTGLLPTGLLAELRPEFAAAETIIRDSGAPLARWASRVTRVPSILEPQPPPIENGVFAAVSAALIGSRCLQADYKARYQTEPRRYVLHPLGLALRGPVAYLVATAGRHDSPAHFALHRFAGATLLKEQCRQPSGFDFAAYMRTGPLSYPVGPRVRLEALFDDAAAFHLSECSIAPDQTLAPAAAGKTLLCATVQDTLQLRWWLLAFGSQVEVIKPKRLRAAIAAEARAMHSAYQATTAETIDA